MHAKSQCSPLIPKRLNVINLLHSLRSQYERMLFQHANAVFDADAHTAEVGWVSFCVGYVEATLTPIKYQLEFARKGAIEVRKGGVAYGSIVTHCLGCNFVFRDWPGVSWTSRPM